MHDPTQAPRPPRALASQAGRRIGDDYRTLLREGASTAMRLRFIGRELDRMEAEIRLRSEGFRS
jgi:hypothetical protein